MAQKFELRTFNDIVTAIMGLVKLQSTDLVSKNRIKSDVNRAMQQEVIPFAVWAWKRKKVQLQTQPYHSTGTASVTSGLATVTLSITLSTSRVGQLFSVSSENDTYRIREHNGAVLTLEAPYTGTTSATASFKIWSESVPLPPSMLEISELTSPNSPRPLQGVGIQEFRRLQASSPKAEGRPQYYSLDDYADPAPYAEVTSLPAIGGVQSSGLIKTLIFASTLGSSSSSSLLRVGDRIRVTAAGHNTYNVDSIVSSISTTGSTNDTITYTALVPYDQGLTFDHTLTVTKLSNEGYEKQKQLLIYPAIYTASTNLYLDYEEELPILEEDTDEPAIPLSDRVVLFWLGLSYAYARERNLEEALAYRQLAEQRLARMAGRTTESIDKPSLVPSRNYLAAKRNATRFRSLGTSGLSGFGGSGGSSAPLGTPNTVAVFNNSQLLDSDTEITTDELHTLQGIDTSSTIEERLDALNTALSFATSILADNAITSAVSFVVAQYNSILIEYSLKRGAGNLEVGNLAIVTDGSSASIAIGPATSIGTLGVDFSVDISGSSVRLLGTTTSTGTAVTMQYRVIKWLT